MEWWTSGWGRSPCEEWEMVLAATNAGATAGVETVATGLTRGAAGLTAGTAATGLTAGRDTEAGLTGDTTGLDTDTGGPPRRSR